MVLPVHIQPHVFFYAVGNTPAVCLTQSIPPDQDAAILLLGCGDARSILFTAYAGLGHKNRKIDLTCCDNELEVLARNITLFTLITDETQGNNLEKIWNLYYHILVDDQSLDLLRKQSSKLKELARDADGWNNCEYGKFLRFVDNHTFLQVKRLWDLYSMEPSNGPDFKQQQEKLHEGCTKARQLQDYVVGGNRVFTGMRSAAPCLINAAADIPQLYSNYWKKGTTLLGQGADSHANLNPMFATLDSAMVLHYGTHPLDGFHIAPAYTPISSQSPLRPKLPGPGQLDNPLKTALAQFRAYAKAFREAVPRLTIRFVNSDALAFCHTLQHLRKYGGSTSAGWYRKLRSYSPLVLDSGDYNISNAAKHAPLVFDGIDTSNLVDHLGCLNIFAATAPLLRPGLASTLSTEMLVLRDKSIDKNTRNLIRGDFPTVAMLFGLIPTQFWTGVGSAATIDEMIYNMKQGDDRPETQTRYICLWKNLGFGLHSESLARGEKLPPSISFNATELASFIYQLYLKMFEEENLMNRLTLAAKKSSKFSEGDCARTSLVAILTLIRNSGVDDWDAFIGQVYKHILNDSSLFLGAHHLQELFVHLHLQGLHKVPNYESILQDAMAMEGCFLRDWKDVPPALSITMVVPRESLSVFQKRTNQPIATPVAHIVLQRARARNNASQSIFGDIQIGFGTLKPSGIKHTEDYTVEVEDDDQQWDGTCPLIVSAVVPSYMVFLDDHLATEVCLALRPTGSALSFADRLGVELVLARSTLGSSDVFITKYRPNMQGHASIAGKAACTSQEADEVSAAGSAGLDSAQVRVRFSASLSSDHARIATLTTRLDIAGGSSQDLLRSGTAVSVSQDSPFEISVAFGPVLLIKNLRLPAPILMAGSKRRVARKSSYVEFIAPVAPQESLFKQPENLYMIGSENGCPKVTNLYYLSLDRLPVFDFRDPSKETWLTTHMTDMFSARERKEREKHRFLSSTSSDVRVNYKDSLFSLFLQFTGVQGDRSYTLFGLHNEARGGVNILILPAHLRLDMSSQSVVLDAAVIPLTKKNMPDLIPDMQALMQKGVQTIRVDDAELLQWKHALPSLVERCRDWDHTSSCEYKTKGKIPVSVGYGEQVLCSCGKGKFPKGYTIQEAGLWKRLSRHAVRAAISPCFSVPFVDRPVEWNDMLEYNAEKESSCRVCGKKAGNTGAALLKCGGCNQVHYCSKECQRIDWKRGHKNRCRLLSQEN